MTIAAAADELVVTSAAIELVIPGQADQDIVVGIACNYIIVRRADDVLEIVGNGIAIGRPPLTVMLPRISCVMLTFTAAVEFS